MAKVTAIRQEAPKRTPEREKLAEAIERKESAQRRLAAIDAEIEKVENESYNAKTGLARAVSAIEETKTKAAEFRIAAALGDRGNAAPSIKEARLAAQEAKDNHEILAQTEAKLIAARKVAQSELAASSAHLEETWRRALQSEPAVARVLAEYDAIVERASEIYTTVRLLEKNFAIPENYKGRGIYEKAEPSAWVAALDELKRDPDARLPE